MSGPSSLYMSAVSNRKTAKKPLTAAQREKAKARQTDSGSMYPAALGATKATASSVRSLRSKSSGTVNTAGTGSVPLSMTSSRTTSTTISTATMSESNHAAGPSRSRSNTAPLPANLPSPTPTNSSQVQQQMPEPDRADLHEVEMMQMARLKLSNKDQEAMRRMRAKMEGSPDWHGGASVGGSPVKVDERVRVPEPIPEAGPSRIPPPKYDHTVMVIGAQGVGKSTFIERAIKSWDCQPVDFMELEQGVQIAVSVCSVPPSSRVEQARTIRFVELDSSHLSLDSPQTFWPDGLGEISGVILCYDGTRATTLSCFDIYLERIAKQGLPMVMIACKTDPDAILEVEAAYGNSLGEPHGTGLIEVSSETSEGRSKMRNGLRWLLYKIEQRARRQLRHLGRLQIPSVPRSPTSSQASGAGTGHRTSPPKPKTSSPPSLASSSLLHAHPSTSHTRSNANGNSNPHLSPIKTHHRSTRTLASSVTEGEGTDHRSSGSSFSWMMNGPFSPTDASTLEGDETATSVGPSKRSSLKMMAKPEDFQAMGKMQALEKEEIGSVEGDNNSSAGAGAGMEGAVPVKPDGQAPMWLSLDILFTKLFSFVVANEDERFIASFFLTYRRFCSPFTLMSEFRARFKEVEEAPIVADAKNWALMKITGQLIDWVAEYPGDLSDQATRDVYQEYTTAALHYTFMAHLTAELVHLGADLHDTKDIDYSWCISNPANAPRPKQPPDPINGTGNGNGMLAIPAEDTSTGTSPANTPLDETGPSGSARRQLDSDTSLVAPSARSVDATSSLTGINGTNGSGLSANVNGSSGAVFSSSRIRQSAEGNRSVSSSSISLGSQHAMYRHPSGPSGVLGLGQEEGTAAQWATAFAVVADGDVRTFAVELTKMQWRVFLAIRPRDVLRHDLGKEEGDPVAVAIAFFNRLSRWVSTIILSNPKPKHRARVYERFILIAHQLRRLNNYDSLYAVISGMKETSVFRLQQTQALISPLAPGQKEFQSHSKLMDPRGGYTLYRRALEADVDNANTAIPLLTSIISMINRLHSVRKEDVREDGDVQWDKFAKFGQILSVITEFQSRGPMVTGDAGAAFKAMINDMPVLMSEDSLFERSRMLEPANNSSMPVRDGRIMGYLQGKQKWADTTRYDW